MTGPLIEARGLTRILPGPVPVTLVEDVDLSVQPGEFIAITGPSGSGKSSLLYLLGLLDVPTRGELRLDGEAMAQRSANELAQLRLEKLGFVFQFHFLLPEFTVVDNLMLPMQKRGGLRREQMRARVDALLDELGLAPERAKFPDQLSGGQRQRVAIARALVNQPRVILADEPTGNLDSRNAGLVFDIFARLAAGQGQTVIAVTHDKVLAGRAGRRVHLVDGRIVEGGAA